MKNASETSEYLILFHGTDWDAGLTPDSAQQIMDAVYGWVSQLTEGGKFLGGQPLGEEARTIKGKNGSWVSDGPYAEAKEVIGGYMIVRAADIEEAAEIGKGFPLLEHGVSVEVRPLVAMCPVMARALGQRGEMVAVE